MSKFTSLLDNEEKKLNDEQRAVVFADKNCVVSAGAGSGKTTVLSYRFLRLVMDDEIKCDRILTLTFTRKAALEMRERITNRLLDNRDKIKPELIENLTSAHISTIDSFLSEIVRHDCVKYGLSRDFSLLSDDEENDLVRTLALSFLEDKGNYRFVTALSRIFSPNDVISSFFLKINQNLSFLSNHNANELFNTFSAYVNDSVEKQRDSIDYILRTFDKRIIGEKGKLYEAFMAEWDSGAVPDKLYFYDGRHKKSYIDGVSEEIKDLKDNYYQRFVSFASVKDNLPKDFIYYQIIEGFAESLIKEKRRRSLLTFNDVFEIALDILEHNDALRTHYKNAFDKIMIDEFQDNNDKQKRLLYLLSEKKDRLIKPCPTINDLESDKLFFVGDDKQSIYRFRGADVSVFRALKDEIKNSGGINLSLSTNYRSEKKLIDHFNFVFNRVFANATENYEALFENTKYARNNGDSRIEVALLNRNDLIPDGLKSDECEAEFIADKIIEILNSDKYLVNGKRVKASDIAILMRGSGNQWQIEKALKLRNIPYQILESRSLMLEGLSSDFYSYLQYLVYPEDKIAFANLLKSPFVRVSDNGFKEILSGQDITNEEDKRSYDEFLALYNEIKAKLYSYTLSQLLVKLYIESGYKAYIELKPKYKPYSEHFDYLFDYAVSYDEEGYTLSDFVRMLRSLIGTSDRGREAKVLKEKLNGVQIMTMHKSKGLEFPIVFCSFLGSKGKLNDKSVLYSVDGNLIFDSTKITKDYLNKSEKDRDEAEIKRILYVAMTRCENYLIMTGSYKLKKDGTLDSGIGKLLYIYLNSLDGCSDVVNLTIPPLENFNYTAKLELEEKKEIIVNSWEEAARFKASLMTIAEKDFDYSSRRVKVTENDEIKYSENRVLLPTFKSDEIIKKYAAFDKFGTLAHLAMELTMKGEGIANIECDIADNISENKIIMDDIKSFIDIFYSSPLYKNWINGKSVDEEVRFYTYVQDSDSVLEGVIDLIVFSNDFNLIVDYKTDRSKNLDDHKAQVVQYIKTATDIYNKPCYGTLFYLRDGSLEPFWDLDGNIVSL